MTNTTTAGRRRRQVLVWGVSITAWVWLLSVLLHGVGLGVLWKADFFDSRVTMNPEEQGPPEELKKLAEQELERRDKEREERELPEEHAELLKEEAELKAERKLVQKIEEIRRNYEAIKEVEEEKLAELEQRPAEMLRKREADEIARQAAELHQASRRLQERADSDPLKKTREQTKRTADGAKKLARQIEDALAKEALAEELAATPEAPPPTADEAPAKPEDAATSPEALAELVEKAEQGVERSLEAVAEAAERAAESAREAAEVAPPEHRPEAEALAAKAEEVAERARRLASEESLDVSAFNDTQQARQPDPITPEDLEDLQAKSPAELYETAQKLEEATHQAAADARAAELAIKQNTSFAEARAKVNAQPPARPDMAEELANPNTNTIAQLNEHRENLDDAVTEAESIRLSTTTQAQQVAALSPNASQATRQSVQSRYAEMILAQQRVEGTISTSLASLATRMNSNRGGAASHLQEALYGIAKSTESGQKTSRHRLDAKQVAAQAMPGRKFDDDSTRSGWLYLDTWYFIGPWENEGNLNFDEPRPPEYEIDFDAEYDGKIDRKTGQPQKLRWQFHQSDGIRIEPPRRQDQSTYYAYTELYFERDMEMLIALASDDSAKLWINGQVAWQDRGLSSYNMGEHSERFQFRQGYNRILVRLENDPAHCYFSLVICPPEALAKN